MQKILITGNAGSGKTTLCYLLATMLNREDIVNLDQMVWKPGWQPTSKDEKELEFEKILNAKTWIVDGVSKKILEAADIIIFLDYPRYICYWRVFKRSYKYAFRSRPELPEKCPEILIIGKVIKIIWNFTRYVKPTILAHIKEHIQEKRIYHITCNTELAAVISEIQLIKPKNS